MTIEPAPNPGQEFQDDLHFALRRKIADGGMGAVYEATLFGSEGFEKIITIKTINEEFAKEQEFVKMFIGEAKLVAYLVHQNVVQIYKLGRIGRQYYIAMEYVNGINLQQFIARHAESGTEIPIELSAFIISRICRGLEYAHRKRDVKGVPLGVVHRDINPKNLMISAEGEVKITDFGIAKARNLMQAQDGQVLMGKAAYMSPEQAQCLHTDRRSDIFSLGIVMYELLTGQCLFGAEENTRIILRNVACREIRPPRELNSQIPPELEKILLKALTRKVDLRYQDAGQMGYDLEHFLYHKGYGPTIVTLEKYMRTLFPELYFTRDKQAATSMHPLPRTGE